MNVVTRVVLENRAAVLIKLIELPVIDGPEQSPDSEPHQGETQGNEDEQDAHAGSARASRRAFITTINELADMPKAASHGGRMSSAASGTATRL